MKIADLTKKQIEIYEDMTSAIVSIAVPATATYIVSLPETVMGNDTKIVVGLTVTWFVGLLSTVSYFLKKRKEKL